jgi:hypothetical protein
MWRGVTGSMVVKPGEISLSHTHGLTARVRTHTHSELHTHTHTHTHTSDRADSHAITHLAVREDARIEAVQRILEHSTTYRLVHVLLRVEIFNIIRVV